MARYLNNLCRRFVPGGARKLLDMIANAGIRYGDRKHECRKYGGRSRPRRGVLPFTRSIPPMDESIETLVVPT